MDRTKKEEIDTLILEHHVTRLKIIGGNQTRKELLSHQGIFEFISTKLPYGGGKYHRVAVYYSEKMTWKVFDYFGIEKHEKASCFV